MAKEKATKAAKAAKASVKARPQLSQEKVVDSEEDSASDTDSDDTSEEEQEQSSGPNVGVNGSQRINKAVTEAQTRNGSVSSDDVAPSLDSSSEDPSSSSEDEAPPPRKRKSQDAAARGASQDEEQGQRKEQEQRPLKRPRFVPPAGYAKLSSAGRTEGIAASKLVGKEIWHITCPSNLPLTALQSATFTNVASGTATITHDGIEYTLVEESTVIGNKESGASTNLLLPGKNGIFASPPGSISRTIHVQQRAIAAGKSSQNGRSTGSRKIRPQPAGLRMHYKPPGFGAGRPGPIGTDGSDESDEEMDDAPAPATFRLPKDQSITASSKKQKQTSAIVAPAKVGKGNAVSDDDDDDEPAATSTVLTAEEREAKRLRKTERQKKRELKEQKRKLKEEKRSKIAT